MDYDHIEHDTSALDEAMKAARDRDRMGAQSLLNRSRAVLLGSAIPVALIAGLTLIGAAAASAWIMRPHFDFHTVNIDVPKFTEKEVAVPKLVEREVEIPKLVEREVVVPRGSVGPKAPSPTPEPQASNAPLPKVEADKNMPAPQILPPKTPDKEENKFLDRPDYKSADVKGRIVRSYDNGLHFETGDEFYPSYGDRRDGKPDYNPDLQADSDPFIGDYGYCNHNGTTGHFYCYVIDDDVVKAVPTSPRTRPLNPDIEKGASAQPSSSALAAGARTPAAAAMIAVDVGVGYPVGVPVEAMVDTGCAWPLSIPKVLADALVSKGLAKTSASSSSFLADGSAQKVETIAIDGITVEGRVLKNVEAAVVASDNAPILLGLGALNQLGPYKIADGKIVFTGGAS
jgi:hypothetical protein